MTARKEELRSDGKGLLRFITCGSVDDGKSTLIGRLLFESKCILDDQLADLVADSKKVGTRGGDIDYALLLDGLEAEREQGITIDVAYRFFATARRKFIVADTPGHEQYTRNMITGASTAELAVILVDARKGVLTQTRRHACLVSLMGIRQVVLAVNKMDLAGFAPERFREIERDYRAFAARIGLADAIAIPVCAVDGDNVLHASGRMPWYGGPTLLHALETAELDETRAQRQPFRMPVQWVNRPDPSFRGYAGTIVSGVVRAGECIRVLPSGRDATVARIVTADGDLDEAVANQSVTLTLAEDLDVSRGDLLASVEAVPEVADQFEATVVWMHEQPLLRGRSYRMKIGPAMATATVAPLKYKLNVDTLEHVAGTRLTMNEIGVVDLELDRPIAFEPYETSRDLGGFILIDRISNETAGAGMLRFALRRSHNLRWQAFDIGKAARAGMKGQKPCVIWLTGLSGSGKSTLGNLLEKRLYAMGRHTYLLDGDNVRHGLNKDLGFTEADRVENIRRIAEVAKLMSDAGLIVITAFISPYRSERRMARGLMAADEFLEVFVDTPLAVAEQRDPKGLYAKARRGELKNFTGIDAPYEAPEAPELAIDTTRVSPGQAVEALLALLRSRGILD
jgi:bifunctional enzyme CysN/CysC